MQYMSWIMQNFTEQILISLNTEVIEVRLMWGTETNLGATAQKLVNFLLFLDSGKAHHVGEAYKN